MVEVDFVAEVVVFADYSEAEVSVYFDPLLLE